MIFNLDQVFFKAFIDALIFLRVYILLLVLVIILKAGWLIYRKKKSIRSRK